MGLTDSTLVVLPPLANDPEMIDSLGLERISAATVRTSVVCYPGHGGRERMPGLRFAAIADEVADTHDGPLDVVGLAIGSYIVAELLIRHPGRVRSALIAASPFTPIADEQRSRDRARASAALAGMVSVVDETLPRWFTRTAIDTGHPGVRLARDSLLAMAPSVWSDLWLAIAERATIDAAAASDIEQPVTVVVPLHDSAGGIAGLLRAHDMLPLSRLVYVDGPHMVNLERPANVLAAIDSHLAWVAAGAPPIPHTSRWVGV